MLPAGIYATGVSVNYTCEELYNWKDGVVGQAFCNDQYQWEVTTLAECISMLLNYTLMLGVCYVGR